MNKLSCKQNILYSFDVFDTLITRLVATPSGIFMMLQSKLLETGWGKTRLQKELSTNFAYIRKQTERYCRELAINTKHEYDCTFDDIYLEIQNRYQLTEEETNYLKNLEKELEYQNSVPIYENINKLKTLINNYDVILISDIYYDADFIRKLLLKHDEVFKNIKIFVSSEIKKSKKYGNLYKHVHKLYNFDKHIHIGDNFLSDKIQAYANGIKPLFYKFNKLKTYENSILSTNKLHANLSIGVSRYLRINHNKNKIYDFAVSYSAPILYDYVYWMLNQAISLGLKHLYFVSRDGYILKEIADIIIKLKNLDITTHYFYSSRLATRICTDKNYANFVKYIFSTKKILTPEDISQYFNISLSNLKEFYFFKKANSKLSKKEIIKLKSILESNNSLKERIIQCNKQRYNLFKQYLEQEINLTNNDFAFVDIRGSGQTQNIIAEIINDISKIRVYSFFASLIPHITKQDNSFIISQEYSENKHIILELLCTNISGQCIGYKETNGVIAPILEYEKNDNLISWGYEQYLQGIKDYSELYCKYYNCIYEFIPKNQNIFMNYISMLDKNIAEILGDIPFAQKNLEKNIKQYAPPYTLYNLLFSKTNNKRISCKRTNSFVYSVYIIIYKIMRLISLIGTK